MPDLRIDLQQRYASDDAVVVEVIISGHHLGVWRGLPPTGRSVNFPLCGIFVFDKDDRLAGEKIYYDRATVLRQLGMFHEPDRMVGRIATVIIANGSTDDLSNGFGTAPNIGFALADDRKGMFFGAPHESAYGPERTSRSRRIVSAFRRESVAKLFCALKRRTFF